MRRARRLRLSPGECRMRDLRILGGLGLLSAAVWSVTAAAAAAGPGGGHGGSHGHAGRESPMRPGGGHSEIIIWLFLPSQLETRSRLFPGEPEPGPAPPGLLLGGLGAGGPEPPLADHRAGPAIHSHAHVAVRVERGEAVIPQPTASVLDGSDQAGAATAQPNPTANPGSPRPPGAGGPGRPVLGRSGPGRPGPGRP